MSGPFPPSGYPQQPDQGGWPGNQPHGTGPTGQYGGYPGEYPAQPNYGGLGGSGLGGSGWGGEDPNRGQPPKQRHLGRTIVGVVSVLVIIGGVVTGAVLLSHRHSTPQAAPQGGGSVSSTPSTPSSSSGSSTNGSAGSIAGQTDQTLAQGDCVSATVDSAGQYDIGAKTGCGGATSDLLLAKVASAEDDCALHQYLLVQGPDTYYCFTLDIKQGDCLDTSYLKVPCGTAAFSVLKTEPGPGGDDSCKDQTAATHWVPAGPDPVSVGCLGPASPS